MIWDKAQELGRQIGQAAEYQALRRAETALREDKETVAKLDQIQTLARQVDQVVSRGQMPDQATAEAYEGAIRDLEMSPTGCSGSRSACRAISAALVPPGSRTTSGSILPALRRSASGPISVDLPEPSGPSRTTKKPRRLIPA